MNNLSNIPEMAILDNYLDGTVFREMEEVESPIVGSHFDWLKDDGPDFDSMAKQQRLEREDC